MNGAGPAQLATLALEVVDAMHRNGLFDRDAFFIAPKSMNAWQPPVWG